MRREAASRSDRCGRPVRGPRLVLMLGCSQAHDQVVDVGLRPVAVLRCEGGGDRAETAAHEAAVPEPEADPCRPPPTGLGAGSGQGFWFGSCVAVGGGKVGLGRRLRGAAERGGWARMWS